jgi:hypothetical protein
MGPLITMRPSSEGIPHHDGVTPWQQAHGRALEEHGHALTEYGRAAVS